MQMELPTVLEVLDKYNSEQENSIPGTVNTHAFHWFAKQKVMICVLTTKNAFIGIGNIATDLKEEITTPDRLKEFELGAVLNALDHLAVTMHTSNAKEIVYN